MVESSKYFIYTQMVNKIPSEQVVGSYKAFSFTDNSQNLEVDNLSLTISSHRLTFSFPTNPDIAFLIDLSSILKMEQSHSGFFSKTLSKVTLHLERGNVQLKSKRLKEPFLQIEA